MLDFVSFGINVIVGVVATEGIGVGTRLPDKAEVARILWKANPRFNSIRDGPKRTRPDPKASD
jgi:hypothetical protein